MKPEVWIPNDPASATVTFVVDHYDSTGLYAIGHTDWGRHRTSPCSLDMTTLRRCYRRVA